MWPSSQMPAHWQITIKYRPLLRGALKGKLRTPHNKNLYPPEGAAIAEPVWGPIDFINVLLFARVAV